MNETMMIEIKASVEEALKKLDEVNKELKDIGEQSKKSGKTMSDSMKSATRSAQLQVEAIKQVVSSLVELGKSSIEAQKEISRLNSAFESSGRSTAQASETYKNIFGFLGDSGAAVEAAQHLANIPTDDLQAYEQILQGVYAKFASIETGGLAEGISHTIALGEVQGSLADAYEFLGISVDEVNAKLATFNSESEREAYIRSSLTALYGEAAAVYGQNNAALISYNQSQANLNVALAEAGSVVTPLLTAFNGLAAELLTSLKPALEVIVAAFVVVIQAISTAIGWIKAFFSIFSGGSKAADTTKSVAKSVTDTTSGFKKLGGGVNDLNKGLDGANKAAKELKKQTMGFDELNVVTDQTAAAASSGAGAGAGAGVGAIEIPQIDMSDIKMPELNLDDFDKTLEEVRGKMQAILVLAGSIAAAIAIWKLTEMVKDAGSLAQFFKNMAPTLQKIGGYILIAAGAIMAAQGYSDAWVNGIDWGNFALTIGGLALAITGVGLAFGGTTAAVVAAGAGIALVVLAIKDMITNGENLRNTLTLLAGLIATFAGTWVAFSAPVALAVTGIVALVAGVVSFINNGPTLQNTILIIGGAIAVAVAAATAGLSLVVAAIVGAIAAVAAFTAAILLEKPAIMSVEEAQEKLNEAKQKAAEAENTYISSVDAAEASLKKLEEAEKAAGVTGESLYAQVQAGTLDYANMTDAQKEVYKAYLDNEKKQEDLKKATEELTAAKREETLASFDNQLAIAKETGNYDDYKASVIAAYNEGKLSADDARAAIEKSMSEMSDASQQAFMEDLPSDIANGMDPHRYESTATKLGKWFSNTFGDIWKGISNWFKTTIAPIFTAKYWTDKFDTIKQGMKAALNGLLGIVEKACNWIVDKLNKLSFDVPDWVPGIGGKKFGFNLSRISIPRLAEGGIVTQSILANIGERGREAVLPLENNTEWMDALADRIAARGNNPTKVILKVGEKELGWATIDAINGITEQTGELKLAL